MTRHLHLDLETYASVSLPKCGTYRYVDSPDFEILLLSYAFDEGPVKLVDLASGDEMPREFLDALESAEVIKIAHQAAFERVCLSKHLGRWLDPRQWRCSVVMASYLTLPLRLADAAVALKLTQQKMEEGKDLIRYFSIPCKPTKANGGRTRNLSEHAPEKWAQYRAYNIQDVETERAVVKALAAHPLPEHEWELYALDQRINDRGVRVDRLLVKQGMRCDEIFSRQAFQRAKDITGLDNPGSVAQLKVWLADQDMPMESLAKKLVQEKAKDTDGVVSELLNLRLEMSKTSVKKYEAIARTVCRDGRVHGLFRFYGASRTGRFSSQYVQLQNLATNHLPDLALARSLVKKGDADLLALCYGSIPNTLSELIRTALIPKDGHRFIVADFSAIEARVLAWLAGEEWVLEEFRGSGKIYEATAARMFHIPVETIVRDHENYAYRQKGKQAVLSCIAEGQLVLTDSGLIPIEQVTIRQRVWDGAAWVAHEGVVYQGERSVITYDGLTATPDHLVWIEGQSWPVQFGLAAASGARLAVTEHCGQAIRLGENHQPREKVVGQLEPLLRANTVCIMPQHSVDDFIQSDAWEIQGVSELLGAPQTHPHVVGSAVDSSETALPKSERPTISPLWSARHSVQLPFGHFGWEMDSGECGQCASRLRAGPNRQQRTLRAGKHPVCVPRRQLRQSKANGFVGMGSGVLAILPQCCDQNAISRKNAGGDHRSRTAFCVGKAKRLEADRGTARLYDIRNAGSHHRFTVSGRLVHNCGYGGGVGALKNMGAKMPEEEMQPLVDAWRGANRRIVTFWRALDNAMQEVVAGQTIRRVGKVVVFWKDNKMFIQLPSKRKLCYQHPRFTTNKFGNRSVAYLSAAKSGRMLEEETFGGKGVENCTQAIARDILAEAMLRLDKAGYAICMHIHDEVVLEMPIGKGSLEEVCAIMGIAPDWAEGLPLRADGYECDDFYRKD